MADKGKPEVSGQRALAGPKAMASGHGSETEGMDDILEAVVRTATKSSKTDQQPRERRRARNVDRKSCELAVLVFSMRLLVG